MVSVADKRRKRTNDRENGWQAEKSAMTRKAILDAAIECFIEIGYANTTTAKIADFAGVSRGAMMHHFPSRLEVLKAAIQYLHQLRIEEYRKLMTNIDVPDKELTRDAIAKSVDAAWKWVNLPSFVAYQEVLTASRTDPELNTILRPIEKDFENEYASAAAAMFPHWGNLGETLDVGTDLVRFLTHGMAVSHMASKRDERARRMLACLTDQLEALYQSASRAAGSTKARSKK